MSSLGPFHCFRLVTLQTKLETRVTTGLTCLGSGRHMVHHKVCPRKPSPAELLGVGVLCTTGLAVVADIVGPFKQFLSMTLHGQQ